MNTQTKQNYDKLFSMFTSYDKTRPKLCRCFKQDGFYYATDGNALIQLPVEAAELNFQEYEDSPKCSSVIPPNSITEKVNIVDLENKITSSLPLVFPSEECEQCEGNGTIECNLGHDHDCEECDGQGYIIHDKLPQIPNMKALVKISSWDTIFRVNVLKRLWDACKIIGVTEIVKLHGTPYQGNKFQCGDFIILIMPCRESDDEEYIKIKF